MTLRAGDFALLGAIPHKLVAAQEAGRRRMASPSPCAGSDNGNCRRGHATVAEGKAVQGGGAGDADLTLFGRWHEDSRADSAERHKLGCSRPRAGSGASPSASSEQA